MIHFSVDDTIEIFRDIFENNYSSVFENKTLGFFKTLKEKYDFKVSMYCFYEDNNYNLSMCTDKYKAEFAENSDWLKFGFHSLNYEKGYESAEPKEFIDDLNKVLKALKNIVSESAVTYDARLHYGRANKACLKAMKECFNEFNVLYGVDDDRVIYYLNEEENKLYLEQNFFVDKEIGITIKNCKLRLECNNDLEKDIKNISSDKIYPFFTHEIHLKDEKILESIKRLCVSKERFVL